MTERARRDIYQHERLYETIHYAAHSQFIQNTAWVWEISHDGTVDDRLFIKGTASRAISLIVGVVYGSESQLAPHGDFDIMDNATDRVRLQRPSRNLTLVAPPAHMFANFHRDFKISCDNLKLLVDVLDTDGVDVPAGLMPERDWTRLKLSHSIFDDKASDLT